MKTVNLQRLWKAALLLLCFGVTACSSDATKAASDNGKSGELEGSVNISGAFALYPLVNVWAQEFTKEHPKVRFNISGGGAGKGMADMLSGATQIGMFSRELTDVEKSRGVWWLSVTKDAVVPTISSRNPVLGQLKKEGLKREELRNFFMKNGKKYWKGSKNEVHVFTRSDAAGAAVTWANYLGEETQEAFKGVAVYGDPGLADAVKNDPDGIGYNNIIYVYDYSTGKKYDGLDIPPIDSNENGVIDPEEDFYGTMKTLTAAIADGRYPSPPSRELYLILNGKPKDPVIKTFLTWILENGQKYVEANGYIKLSEATVKAQMAKLN